MPSSKDIEDELNKIAFEKYIKRRYSILCDARGEPKYSLARVREIREAWDAGIESLKGEPFDINPTKTLRYKIRHRPFF